jgi:hypothetical protein
MQLTPDLNAPTPAAFSAFSASSTFSTSATSSRLPGSNGTGALHLALAAAVTGLLGGAAQAEGLKVPAAAPAATWQADAAVLLYKEGDGRVTALEPVISLRRNDGNDRATGLRLTLDTLTGASPNGAVAQPTAQTFTSPSGKGTYTAAAGQTPLNPEFRDTRIALLASHERPLGADQRGSFSANVSAEHDFASFGLSGSWTRDFDNKNRTLSLGLSTEFDRINPEGGVPVERGVAFAGTSGASNKGSDSRYVVDLLAGFTQVMSRRWITQVSYNLGRGSGYHSDPYKILSVIDGSSGLVTGDRYINESRPRSRTRHSLNVQSKWHLTQDVVDLSYRYYRDDWGVSAHTLDGRYRWELGSHGGSGDGGPYIEPHLRWYRQSAADFYRTWLTEGGEYVSGAAGRSPAYASADTRLAAFTGQTLGVKLGLPTGQGREWTLRVETYRQKIDQPANAPGALRSLDLTPDLKAFTLMVGYSRPF